MMRTSREARRGLAFLLVSAAIAWGLNACTQTPPTTVDPGILGEGDTLEYAPGVSGEVRTVTLPGPEGEPFTFTYEVIDGLAIVQGDMIVGTAEDFATLEDADEIEIDPQASVVTRRLCWKFLGVTVHCEHFRWPDAVVPYTFLDDWDIASTATNENAAMRATIRAAMDALEAVTAVRFVPRTDEPNYVRFRLGKGCSSWVGRQGGAQSVNLAHNCNQTWIVAHEIMHALGLSHEQSRHNRDTFVQIHWDNIIADKKHNFEVADYSFDFGTYDYDSLMHYSSHEFCTRDATNTCVGPTITTIPPGTAIGQRSHISTTDVQALNRMYPGLPPTLSITNPSPGSTYSRRAANVSFSADVDDPEDMEVEVTWRSDVDGVLGTGNPFMLNSGEMAYGVHVVTARGVDPQGHVVTDTVTFEIVNDPPTVDIFDPLAGDFCVDESITFRATVIDKNELGATLPDGSVTWRVGSGASFATGKTATRSFASAGNVQVVARAVDPLGLEAEDWINLGIEACSDMPPTVAITNPAADVVLVYDGRDDGRGQWYADVTLTGSASDPEDGALTGGSLVWTTDRSTVQNAVLGTGSSLNVRLYSDVCEGLTHTITLSATDSEGNVRSATVRIRIWTLC